MTFLVPLVWRARLALPAAGLLLVAALLLAGCDSDGGSEDPSEDPIEEPDEAAPAAPAGVEAVVEEGADGKRIRFSWEPVEAEDVASYRVSRGTDPEQLSTVDTLVAGAATVYLDEDVSGGTTYYYRVRAVDESGNVSEPSSQAQAALDLSAPTGLTAEVAEEESEVRLAWDAVDAEGLAGYRLYRAPESPADEPLATIEAGQTTYTDADVEEGQRYVYRVTARKDGMESAFSEEADAAVPDRTAPSAPANLTADAGDGQVGLAWDAAADAATNVTAYRLYRGTDGPEPTTLRATTEAGTTTFVDEDVENGETYFYRITAVDEAGNESAFSAAADATPEDGAAPLAPANLTAEAGSDDAPAVTLSWEAPPSDDVATYRLVRGTEPNPTTLLATIDAGQTTYTDADVNVGPTYYYRLRAVDGAGNVSAFSNEASAQVADETAPPPPVDLTAEVDERANGQVVELDWRADPATEPLAEYRIYRDTEPNPTAEIGGTAPDETEYVDEDVQPGETYFYRVTAVDEASNESDFSDGAEATLDEASAAIECVGGEADGYPCENVDLLAHLSISELGGGSGASLNEVWGWRDPQTGRRYALVGRTDGLAFVDVTTPTAPVFLGSLPTATFSSTWRDVKVKDDYAVVGSEANGHGLQIFDLTELRGAADEAPQTFSPTAVYEGFGSSHNVVTGGEGTPRVYGVGLSGAQSAPPGAGCGAGYHAVDLSNPANPQFAGCFNSSLGGFVANGYSHDAQCVTYDGPDSEHQGQEICVGSDETGFSVADLTDLDDPRELAAVTYPNTGYAHQGWFGENHRYFYADDETDEQSGLVNSTRTLVWDMQDLDAPVLVTQYQGETTAIDHNQYLVEGYAYQANYTSGLRILDANDKENPVEVGFFDTYPSSDASFFDGAWGNYPFFDDGTVLISSIGEGLFIVRPTGPAER